MSAGSNPSLYWYVGRGSGFVAYLLLTASVCLGIALSRRWRARHAPAIVVDELHRWLAIVFYAFVALHVVMMALDPFVGFSVADLLVPFQSDYRALWLSLGIVAAEVALAVGASVWVRRWIGYRAWHVLHGLTYPVFLATLLHSLGTGTDTRTTWGALLYGGSLALVLAAIVWRVADERVWRGPAVATTFVATALILVWALSGPYAGGWTIASGTPQTLLADQATLVDAAPSGDSVDAALATRQLANLRVTISGTTTMSDGDTVLLRGQSPDANAIQAAVQFVNARTADGVTGEVQLRAGAQLPLCAGPITGADAHSLTASCSGYGQTERVTIRFTTLTTQDFTADVTATPE
jgi:sulfoxide reductase heme-binding subunit YedZ